MTQQTPQAQVGKSVHSGRMTAVMRAISPQPGPRVLRIGVVHAGKVVEERVLTRRTHVTVGTKETCTFVLSGAHLPPTFRLFELAGDHYRLSWLDTMSGRVALETGVTELSAIRGAQARTTPSGQRVHQFVLGSATRGKIVIGDTTFLFQLVMPPPLPLRPQLPSNVRRGTGLDWNTTLIAAFSFLFHFGLVGSIYSDWMDPMLDEDARTAQLVESLRQLPPPPAVEVPLDAPSEVSTAPAEKVAEQQLKNASAVRRPTTAPGGASATSDAKAAAISREMSAMNLEMIAALTPDGSSTERLLRTSDVPTGLLDDAAASNRSVGGSHVGGLDLVHAGDRIVRPGETGGADFSRIGDTRRGDAPTPGTARTTSGPRGNANVGPPQPSGGSVANAAAVVAQMQAGFRRCYNRELPNNPDMKGSVRITAKIGPNGEVAGASASGGGGLSPGLISCVTGRVGSAQFAPPEGGGATIVIPVSFFPQ